MAVAHDAASESHTGTTASTNQASFSWSHDPVGTPRGVLVYTFVLGSASDLVTGVTYGGAALTAVTGGRAVDTATEPGDCKTWYLGSSVPTDDPATVEVTRTNNASAVYAICITVTAGGDTEVTGIVLEQENQGITEENVDDGSPGTNSVRYAGIYYGGSATPTTGANSTALPGIIVGAARSAWSYQETTAGQGSRPVGASAGSDDIAAVYLAIREVASGDTLTGAVLSVTPSLPAARLDYALLGAALGITPSLPAGQLNYTLPGAALTITPSMPAGAVSEGGAPITLDGVVLTASPSLPAGQVNVAIPGAVLTIVPSLPTGRVDRSFNATVLSVTPTLPQGQVNYSLVGQVLTITPSLPVATAVLDRILTGIALTVVPSLPIGLLTFPQEPIELFHEVPDDQVCMNPTHNHGTVSGRPFSNAARVAGRHIRRGM